MVVAAPAKGIAEAAVVVAAPAEGFAVAALAIVDHEEASAGGNAAIAAPAFSIAGASFAIARGALSIARATAPFAGPASVISAAATAIAAGSWAIVATAGVGADLTAEGAEEFESTAEEGGESHSRALSSLCVSAFSAVKNRCASVKRGATGYAAAGTRRRLGSMSPVSGEVSPSANFSAAT